MRVVTNLRIDARDGFVALLVPVASQEFRDLQTAIEQKMDEVHQSATVSNFRLVEKDVRSVLNGIVKYKWEYNYG